MEQILTTFGIDWRLLLINAINFGLVLLVLWYFLYAPITKMLEERRKKVIQGVHDAQAVGVKLAGIEQVRAQTLANAGKEADTILSRAQSAGLAKERELIAQAEGAAESVLTDAHKEAAALKVEAIEESKEEVAKMIVLGVEKMLAQK
jgi:F-type H+-transporting ATPase subunit b